MNNDDLITITYNGVTLTGRRSDIQAMGIPIGPMYNSETNGKILISGMHTTHVLNAVGKKYRAWLDQTLDTTRNNLATVVDKSYDQKVVLRGFAKAMSSGPTDSELLNLLAELVNRGK